MHHLLRYQLSLELIRVKLLTSGNLRKDFSNDSPALL